MPDPLGVGVLERAEWIGPTHGIGRWGSSGDYWHPMSRYSGAWQVKFWHSRRYSAASIRGGEESDTHDCCGFWLTRDGRVFSLRGHGLGRRVEEGPDKLARRVDNDFMSRDDPEFDMAWSADSFDLRPISLESLTPGHLSRLAADAQVSSLPPYARDVDFWAINQRLARFLVN